MSVKVTRVQLTLIREGVRPGIHTMGSGGGRVVADPRTIRSLVAKKLAFIPPAPWDRRYGCVAYLTRAGYVFVGAEPPKKHPTVPGKAWP